MGLFQHRPEEPTEWGGLPSEPLDSEFTTDLLSENARLPQTLLGAGQAESDLFGTPSAVSISIPLEDLEADPAADSD